MDAPPKIVDHLNVLFGEENGMKRWEEVNDSLDTEGLCGGQRNQSRPLHKVGFRTLLAT